MPAEATPRPWIVIHLWGLHTDECPMCGRERVLSHAVGWFCGPVKADPGQQVPGWQGEAIAGGMPVCVECHDGFYGGPNHAP